MTTVSPISRPAALWGATVAAALLVLQGVIQLTHDQSSVSTTEGFVEHLGLAAMTASCLALVLPVLHLGHRAAAMLPARLASGGLVALGLLCVVSNVQGEDPSFFAAIAVPANLLCFGGLIALGVALRRRGVASLAVAIALPLTWPLALVGAQAGGGILAAALWLLIARALLTAPATGHHRAQAVATGPAAR